jgi:hypothetical protein
MTGTLLEWRAPGGIVMDKQAAEKLVPPLPASRIDRQWRGIETRLTGARFWPFGGAFRAPLGVVALAAVAAIALGVWWLKTPRGANEVAAAQTFDNASREPAMLRLADGSKLQVSPGGHVEIAEQTPKSVRLVLTQGWVELDVTHVEGRSFVVQAGDVEVAVRGTRFRVELSSAATRVVSVSVQRGQVAVTQKRAADGATKLLSAGMAWTMGQRDDLKNATDVPPPSTETVPAPTESASPDSAVNRMPEAAGPKQLLERADAARQAGHPREAAAALDELRRHYRSDGRAGLAALQLGRLRLDSLHDAAGALEAFRDALTLSASPAVQEDALARQAQALEALGNVAGCRRVQSQYLSRYPSGIHSASIAKRCGGK